MRRFWDKVQIGGLDECWEWAAALNKGGYGVFGTNHDYGTQLSHRIAYILTHGKIPQGILILHSCDNRSCCNPIHLFQGSHKDNTQDMWNKGRSGRNKVTPRQALLIRSDTRPPMIIAKEHGITLNMVYKIKSHHSWSQVS
jgi:hypothetical protein